MTRSLLVLTVLFASLLGGYLSPFTGITLFFALVVLLFLTVRPVIRLGMDGLASLLFALFGVVSVSYAGDKWGAILFSGSFMAGSLFYISIRNIEGCHHLLLKTLLLGGCITALCEVLRQAGVVVHGLFYNPNPFSGFLTPLLPIALYLYSKEKRKSYAFASGLLVFANLLSGSRTGVLTMLLGLVAIYVYVFKQKDRDTVRTLLLVAVAGFSVFLVFSHLKDFLMIKGYAGLLEKPPSGITQRFYLLKVTLGLIAHSPVLGYGLNSFESVMSAVSNPYVVDRAIHAHSLYLNILTELGIAGFVLFLVYLWFVLRGSSQSPFFFHIALLSFLFHNIVEYNFPAFTYCVRGSLPETRRPRRSLS